MLRPLLLFGLSALWSLTLSVAPLPAGPRDEVLRLVPDDAGFCVLVTDLRGRVDQIRRSPFAERFLASPVGKALLATPEARKVAELDGHLRLGFNSSWDQFRDEILGDALVLTFTPGPPGKPELDRALLALHARDPKLLARMLDRLNVLQKQSGELTDFERRDHRGVTYWLRRKKAEGDEYAAAVGPLFLLSDKEEAVRSAIDRAKDAAPPRLTARLAELGVESAAAVWWFNPRAFDAALKQKIATTDGPEAAFLRTYLRYWEALDDAALHLHIGRDIELAFTVRARPGAIPSGTRPFLADAAAPSAALAGFPPDALFVAGGRVSVERLAAVGGEFLSPEARREVRAGLDRGVGAVLGQEAMLELLRAVGPDWGVCVAPPSGDGWLPALTAAIRLPSGGDPPLERKALEGLDFAAKLAVIAFNSQSATPWRVRSEMQGEVEVRSIEGEGGLPPGWRPAFAWKDGYLVVASSPDAVRRFQPPKAEAAAAAGEVPVARLSLKRTASYVRANRDRIAAHAATASRQSPNDVRHRIDVLLAVLDLFDSAEVTQRADAGTATLTLRLKPAASFTAEPSTKKPH